MFLALTAALLSSIGITITGFYPGIILLLVVPLIPISSKLFAKTIIGKSGGFQRNYYTAFVILAAGNPWGNGRQTLNKYSRYIEETAYSYREFYE